MEFNIILFLKKKKLNESLSKSEIFEFVKRVTEKTIPDYQVTAFLMAVSINGLSDQETTWLTQAMALSGKVYKVPNKGNKILIDKHSSGGIGDKSTFILSPILACAGLYVFKASGKGLGFTGGTIDKLASVGVRTDRTFEDAVKIIDESKIVILSQTSDVAPADKILYSLRDVTSTVESTPLIASSIMSKKMGFEVDYLFLDVKYGTGAFCKTLESAKELSQIMGAIGRLAGMNVSIHITSMQQPLGYAVGNALEVLEVRKFFKGEEQAPDLREYVLSFASDILVTTGKASSEKEARKKVEEIISSGQALRAMDKWFECQGADMETIGAESYFNPKYSKDVVASVGGYFGIKNNEDVGHISNRLGAGRLKADDEIDFQAGIFVHKKLNDLVKVGDVLYTLYSSKEIDDVTVDLILKNTDLSDQPHKENQFIIKYC